MLKCNKFQLTKLNSYSHLWILEFVLFEHLLVEVS